MPAKFLVVTNGLQHIYCTLDTENEKYHFKNLTPLTGKLKNMTLDYKIAVVVLNWNGKTLLRQFLPSLIEHSKEATVYLADNASTDGSVPFVSENFKSVQIIENQENLGMLVVTTKR